MGAAGAGPQRAQAGRDAGYVAENGPSHRAYRAGDVKAPEAEEMADAGLARVRGVRRMRRAVGGS